MGRLCGKVLRVLAGQPVPDTEVPVPAEPCSVRTGCTFDSSGCNTSQIGI